MFKGFTGSEIIGDKEKKGFSEETSGDLMTPEKEKALEIYRKQFSNWKKNETSDVNIDNSKNLFLNKKNEIIGIVGSLNIDHELKLDIIGKLNEWDEKNPFNPIGIENQDILDEIQEMNSLYEYYVEDDLYLKNIDNISKLISDIKDYAKNDFGIKINSNGESEEGVTTLEIVDGEGVEIFFVDISHLYDDKSRNELIQKIKGILDSAKNSENLQINDIYYTGEINDKRIKNISPDQRKTKREIEQELFQNRKIIREKLKKYEQETQSNIDNLNKKLEEISDVYSQEYKDTEQKIEITKSSLERERAIQQDEIGKYDQDLDRIKTWTGEVVGVDEMNTKIAQEFCYTTKKTDEVFDISVIQLLSNFEKTKNKVGELKDSNDPEITISANKLVIAANNIINQKDEYIRRAQTFNQEAKKIVDEKKIELGSLHSRLNVVTQKLPERELAKIEEKYKEEFKKIDDEINIIKTQIGKLEKISPEKAAEIRKLETKKNNAESNRNVAQKEYNRLKDQYDHSSEEINKESEKQVEVETLNSKLIEERKLLEEFEENEKKIKKQVDGLYISELEYEKNEKNKRADKIKDIGAIDNYINELVEKYYKDLENMDRLDPNGAKPMVTSGRQQKRNNSSKLNEIKKDLQKEFTTIKVDDLMKSFTSGYKDANKNKSKVKAALVSKMKTDLMNNSGKFEKEYNLLKGEIDEIDEKLNKLEEYEKFKTSYNTKKGKVLTLEKDILDLNSEIKSIKQKKDTINDLNSDVGAAHEKYQKSQNEYTILENEYKQYDDEEKNNQIVGLNTAIVELNNSKKEKKAEQLAEENLISNSKEFDIRNKEKKDLKIVISCLEKDVSYSGDEDINSSDHKVLKDYYDKFNAWNNREKKYKEDIIELQENLKKYDTQQEAHMTRMNDFLSESEEENGGQGLHEIIKDAQKAVDAVPTYLIDNEDIKESYIKLNKYLVTAKTINEKINTKEIKNSFNRIYSNLYKIEIEKIDSIIEDCLEVSDLVDKNEEYEESLDGRIFKRMVGAIRGYKEALQWNPDDFDKQLGIYISTIYNSSIRFEGSRVAELVKNSMKPIIEKIKDHFHAEKENEDFDVDEAVYIVDEDRFILKANMKNLLGVKNTVAHIQKQTQDINNKKRQECNSNLKEVKEFLGKIDVEKLKNLESDFDNIEGILSTSEFLDVAESKEVAKVRLQSSLKDFQDVYKKFNITDKENYDGKTFNNIKNNEKNRVNDMLKNKYDDMTSHTISDIDLDKKTATFDISIMELTDFLQYGNEFMEVEKDKFTFTVDLDEKFDIKGDNKNKILEEAKDKIIKEHLEKIRIDKTTKIFEEIQTLFTELQTSSLEKIQKTLLKINNLPEIPNIKTRVKNTLNTINTLKTEVMELISSFKIENIMGESDLGKWNTSYQKIYQNINTQTEVFNKLKQDVVVNENNCIVRGEDGFYMGVDMVSKKLYEKDGDYEFEKLGFTDEGEFDIKK